MKNFAKISFLILSLTIFLLPVQPAKADSIFCFCSVDTGDVDKLKAASDPICEQMTTDNCNSYAANLEKTGKSGFACLVTKDKKECTADSNNWKKQKAKGIADLAQSDKTEKKIAASKQSQFLPACILADKLDLSSSCGDITIFVKLMLDIVNYLLSFVGGLALLFFIYGGFVLIFSSGAPDKITQGKEIIVGALIGLVVAFCGYVLVSFLGDAVGISSVYKLK